MTSLNSIDALHVCQFDGNGGVLSLTETSQPSSIQPFWLHLDHSQSLSEGWLKNTPLLPDSVRDALAGGSTRPRMTRFGNGLLLVLNAINFNKESSPEQLIALKVYLTDSLIVSTQDQEVLSLDSVLEDMKENTGPINTSEWLVELASTLTDHATEFIGDLHEKIIDMEDDILQGKISERSEMPLLRKQLIILRRYFSPQRDMFSLLASEHRLQWMGADDRVQMQAVADRLGRGLEDVDASIARTVVISDEIAGVMAEAMNRRTYIMSILAMIFFPTTLLTGLFGANLAGTPGTPASSGLAFPIFCFVLFVLGGGVMWWLKRSRWL